MGNLSGKAAVFCISIVLITAFIFHPKWKSKYTEATLSWDVSGYYMYLPAMFIYKDIKECKFLPSIITKYGPTPEIQQGFMHQPSGHFVMKYPMGQALLMSPFFFIGHLIALMSGSETDGFSQIYQTSIGIGMLTYSILGIYFLYLVLIRSFADKIAALTLMIIVLGTNYLLYASTDQAMTHGPLFFLYSFLIYLSYRFYEDQRLKWLLLSGLTCGLMTLIRPTELISVLIPIFWGLQSMADLKERIQLFRSKYKWVIYSFVALLSIVSLQVLYWKYVTNEWVVYSYQDQGFSFLSPHFKDFTFSFSSGWLMYTPMMILAVLGLPFLITKGKNPIVWVFSILAYYIVCSWDVWDYGGNSGRDMVQYYPLLAISVGTLFQKVSGYKPALIGFVVMTSFFAYFNTWWVYHCYRGEVPALGHSKHFYYAKAGRWKMDEEDIKLMDNKYLFKGQKKNISILEANLVKTQEPLIIGKGIEYTPEMHFLNNGKAKQWIKIYADVSTPVKEWNNHARHIMVYKFYNGNRVERQGMLKPQRFLNDGERKIVDIDCLVPLKWDKLAVFFWNPGSDKDLIVRSVMVETFDEK